MNIRNNSIWDRSTRIPEIYGTLIFLGLLVYFFVAYLFNFVHIAELRLLNLAIIIAGTYFGLRQYRRTHRGHMDYFHTFTKAMAMIAIGTLTFAAFLLLYLHIDKNLMGILAERQPLGIHLNPYIVSFTVSLEGVFSGLFVSFLLSNYMSSRSTIPQAPKASELIH
jgi:hypothetical protein